MNQLRSVCLYSCSILLASRFIYKKNKPNCLLEMRMHVSTTPVHYNVHGSWVAMENLSYNMYRVTHNITGWLVGKLSLAGCWQQQCYCLKQKTLRYVLGLLRTGLHKYIAPFDIRYGTMFGAWLERVEWVYRYFQSRQNATHGVATKSAFANNTDSQMFYPKTQRDFPFGNIRSPFYHHGPNFIITWWSNYIYYTMRNEISFLTR